MKIAVVMALGVDKRNPRRLSVGHVDRLEKAMQLLREKKVGKIVVTGSYGRRFWHQGSTWEMSKKWLVENGVPEDKILAVPNSRSTVEEVTGANGILKQHKPSEVHVVTSEAHLPRALALFRLKYPNQKFVPQGVKHAPGTVELEPETRGKIERDKLLVRISNISPRLYKLICDAADSHARNQFIKRWASRLKRIKKPRAKE